MKVHYIWFWLAIAFFLISAIDGTAFLLELKSDSTYADITFLKGCACLILYQQVEFMKND